MSVSLIQFDRIQCDHHRGCHEFYEGDPIGCCYSAETRKQAREVGWEVNVQSIYSQPHRRRKRLDFCPKHKRETGEPVDTH